MTYLNIHTRRPHRVSVLKIIAHLIERARMRRRIRRELIGLSELPDRLLRDMGLHDRVHWREKGARDADGWPRDPMRRRSF